MNLQLSDITIFTAEAVNNKIPDKLSITVSKYGSFRLSKSLTNHLELKNGDHIVLAQNKHNRKQWYLIPRIADGFKVHLPHKGKPNVEFICIRLSKEFFKSLDIFDGQTYNFLVSKHSERIGDLDAWALITSSVKKPV